MVRVRSSDRGGESFHRRAARRFRRAHRLVRRRLGAAAGLWRRSLQVRVVVSTLALSSAVVFVLVMVLQTQIISRLIDGKRDAALEQAQTSREIVSNELRGSNPNSDGFGTQLSAARNTLSTRTDQDSSGSAGVFDPVLADFYGRQTETGEPLAQSGPLDDIPEDLRRQVEDENSLASQITTVDRDGQPVTMLAVGIPVPTVSRTIQLYQLYPLTPEQRTISLVQSTLLVGGLALVVLLGGVTYLVTRQVVRPVREAAEVAERFADGDLDDRMRATGEDEVARLAESFNAMAESLQGQIRQLEEFGQLQRRFTSDVSHELRTPLTTVRMAADVLHASRDQFPAGLARSTELLVNELDRFESLLSDLLEISRLDAGVIQLSAESVDLRPVVRSAAESVRAIAATAKVRIDLHLPPDPVMVAIDSRRIERVLRNLLANAVDHGEGKPVEVRVGESSAAVAVTVRDFGVGLRPGEEELVFNRFWRADPSRNRHSGGTGLGLAISLEDARLHNGELEAVGEPGEGACFRLTLPRRPGIELTRSPLPLMVADPSWGGARSYYDAERLVAGGVQDDGLADLVSGAGPEDGAPAGPPAPAPVEDPDHPEDSVLVGAEDDVAVAEARATRERLEKLGLPSWSEALTGDRGRDST
ncbi:MtrAB system histidine kinase MtrB [Actinoalloteichus caeruleus]|uniref:MtrAB system histidine kinase MtrB n=1 Tax=Actinoalloteichus cyanogriseus TaxID=2893586 RepID=UPI003BB95E14